MSIVDDIRQRMAKAADAPANNELDPNQGVNDVRKNPPDRSPKTLDARWGDHPPEGHNGYPDVYGTAAVREAHDGRAALIERLFDSPKTTAPIEQALMTQLLSHAHEGHPHSPLLQRGRLQEEKTAADETLTDQVNRVVGFR
jgi:hypothetical protein